MRNYFKKVIYCIVIIGVSSANAGSYEDFFIAIKQDNPKSITSLLERGFDPNTLSPSKQDGLYTALQDGSLKVAQVLVDWPKTNVEIRTPQDESPLMMAALKGQQELVSRLIARDADINKPGWTPLHYAATNGHVAVMKQMLHQHAFIDAQSPNGTTPLMMAAMYGSTAAVRLLVEEGADPLMKNEQGMTAADFAQRVNRPDAIQLIGAAVRIKRPSDGKW